MWQSVAAPQEAAGFQLTHTGAGAWRELCSAEAHFAVTNDFPDFITEAPVSWDNPSAPGKQEWLVSLLHLPQGRPTRRFSLHL